MTELEMFDNITALNDLDNDVDDNLTILTNVVQKLSLSDTQQENYLYNYTVYSQELKSIQSQLVGLYLEKIIEARAT